jgi:hypothetical protein
VTWVKCREFIEVSLGFIRIQPEGTVLETEKQALTRPDLACASILYFPARIVSNQFVVYK